MENFEILYFAKLGVILFVAILFLQSGFDKIFDYKGNKDYIKSVFSITPLNSISSIMFIGITFLEIVTGLVALIGLFVMLFARNEEYSIYALILGMISLLALFGGQRIAKDYAGAAGIVPYFILIILGLLLFAY
jgi:putative oxidoreductase